MPSVTLRPVKLADLPTFFEHQADPAAARLAAFPSRDRDAFFTHWTTHVLGNPANASRTILFNDQIAGNIGAWTDPATHDRLVGYWIGREFWGRGIASAALSQFLEYERTRPLLACVAAHNRPSIRVLEKTGFIRTGQNTFTLPDGTSEEEFVYTLA
jgi:Acetyltransferases, including N-acetylases of ribosomal proteins